jgi:hypothetical protein
MDFFLIASVEEEYAPKEDSILDEKKIDNSIQVEEESNQEE